MGHEVLSTSFRNLRLVNYSEDDLSEFSDMIVDLKNRHVSIVELFAQAASGLQQRGILQPPEIDQWLAKVMDSRIGTEMLTEHFLSLMKRSDKNHVGIVDTKCDPARICQQAIDHISSFSPPKIKITLATKQPNIEFSFISMYLFYIIEELLKNSVSATLRQTTKLGKEPEEVKITVCADSHRIGIKVSDKGGGVSFEDTDKVWMYMYSTTPDEIQSHFSDSSPLSGPGMGLSFCKLYTEYLGGSLHLMSMPGVGTDAYIFLNRIDAGSE